MSQALLSAYGNPLRICDAADFDGTNDYMTRGAGLTGAADSKLVTFSLWMRPDADGSFMRIVMNATTLAGTSVRFGIQRLIGNSFQFIGLNAAAATILNLFSNSTYAGATWRHVLGSFDMSDTAKRHLYVNDSEDMGTVTTYTDDSIDFTVADWAVGARPDGADKTNACLAEVYCAPGQYLDLSLVANRRKFISASGKPVHLGADGSLPTGIAPLMYHHIDDGEAVANFATNRGSGGNFTITGTLDTASSSPSD